MNDKIQEALKRQVFKSTGGRCITCCRKLQFKDPSKDDYMVLDYIKKDKSVCVVPSCHECLVEKIPTIIKE